MFYLREIPKGAKQYYTENTFNCPFPLIDWAKGRNISWSINKECLEKTTSKLPQKENNCYIIIEKNDYCVRDNVPHGECKYAMGISGCYFRECPKQKITAVDMFVNFLKDNANDMCIDYDKMAEMQEKFAQMLFKNTSLTTWYSVVSMRKKKNENY